MASTLFLDELAALLMQAGRSTPESESRSYNSTTDAVLKNMPEILLTLFAVNTCDQGWSGQPLMHRIELGGQQGGAGKLDVSMESEHSIANISKQLYDAGKSVMHKVVGSHQSQVYFHFLKVLQALTFIMDPRAEGSISSIAMSQDGLSFFHKVPFERLLSPHEIRLITQGGLA
jgi:hypothetical protein